jgi:heme-degrading monooxygenase HmoA
MAAISSDLNFCKVLEIFSVSPESQNSFVESVKNFTTSTVKNKSGFIASNILKSLDRIRVINYVQWQNLEAYQTARASTEFQANIEADKDSIESLDTNIYKVSFTNGESATVGLPYDRTIMTNLLSKKKSNHICMKLSLRSNEINRG